MMAEVSLSFTVLLAVLGALGGSVLNVVVHRGPHVWGLAETPGPEERFDLFWPRSHCPACRRTLAAWELVPIASWLGLRGRCRTCRAPISARYPVLEGLGLACGVFAALIVPVSPVGPFPGLGAFVLLSFLILILGGAAVDAETGYLPDALTGPATWLALLASLLPVSVPPTAAITGAAAGYLVFRGVAAAYRTVRGQEGLGQGDAKLLAAGGAWLGPLALPVIVFAAALAGIAYAVATGRRSARAELRFGPFLALGILAAMLITAVLPGRVVPLWPFG